MGYMVSGAKVYDVITRTWWEEQVRTDILIPKQEVVSAVGTETDRQIHG